MIKGKKADMMNVIMLVVVGLVLLFTASLFYFNQSSNINDAIVNQFSDEVLEDMFDLPLTDGTGAIKYNSLDELPKYQKEYAKTIINQIFNPDYEYKVSGDGDDVVHYGYKNSKKELTFFSKMDSGDSYGIYLEDDGTGIIVYIINDKSQKYEYTNYESTDWLKGKHLAVPLVDETKEQDDGVFHSFTMTWIFSKYNKYLTYLEEDHFIESDSYNRINEMLEVWRENLSPEEIKDYMIPVKAIQISNGGDSESPIIAWKDFEGNTDKKDLAGDAHLTLRLNQYCKLAELVNEKTNKNTIDESDVVSFHIFFPVIGVDIGDVFDTDTYFIYSYEDSNPTFSGVGYLNYFSVNNVLDTLSWFE